MNLFDRFILTVYSLALIVISIIAIGVFSNLIDSSFVESFVLNIYAPGKLNLPYLIVAVVFFLISVRFLFSAFRPSKSREDKAIFQRNDLGHVSISFDTIRAVAERAARKVKGVRDLKTDVRLTEPGSVVVLRVTVDGEVPIPEITQQLQYEVKTLVEAIAGIDVVEVSVIVSGVAAPEHQSVRIRRLE